MKHFWTTPRDVPIIVAHRGASHAAPENTLAAFRKAVAEGAAALEFDVRLTRDGEVIVFHDQRLGRTSDGKGTVGEIALHEIRRLSAGRWFHERFASEKIPLLSEVLEEFGKKIGLNIELKAQRYSSAPSLPDRVLSVIRNARLSETILVTSFIHPYITRMKNLAAEIPAGLLLFPHSALAIRPSTLKRNFRVDYVVIGGASLRKSTVSRSHLHGMLVAEYTVNTERRYVRALRFGIDAVITDDPSLVLSFQKKQTPV